MAKEKKPEFKMGGFCKYVLKKWPILLCCLIIGVCISAYSWKHQNLAYDAQTTLLLHDKVDTAGDNDEYAQIVNILSSKEAYAKIGVDVKDVDLKQNLDKLFVVCVVQSNHKLYVNQKEKQNQFLELLKLLLKYHL